MLRRPPSRLAVSLLPLSLGLLLAPGCGRDHQLGITTSSTTTTTTGSGGAGGTGGAGGATGSAGGAGGTGGTPSTSSSGSGGQGGDEPSGPPQLTIVNGVNDYDAIRICFLPYPAGDPAALPWPSSAAGLAFAGAAVINPISSAIPAGTDVRPHVIAGDLQQTAGKTCGQILALAGADPAPIVVTPLAVVPAQAFTSERSLLLAPIGCLGGPGHDGPTSQLACGNTYSPATPTASIVALGMSRKNDPFKMTFQVVNASTALQPTDVQIRPGFSMSTDVLMATNVSTGEIAPKPPFMGITLATLGAVSDVKVETFLPMQQQMFMTASVPLPEAIAHGTVSVEDIDDGAGLVLVAVGGYPGVDPGSPYHKLTFTLIKADP
ncbi:MAG: hypothetical protein U0359_37485 [Byssovorax sp.]